MKRYPVSILAVKGLSVSHLAALFEAASDDECRGKGMRLALRAYPRSDGWSGHDIAISEPDHVSDPATAEFNPGLI